MRTSLEVTAEQSIAASPDVVWSLLADPATYPRLDKRYRLESTSGEAGTVSSEYLLAVKAGLFTKVRFRFVVVEAERPTRLVTESWRGEKPAGGQRAEIRPEGEGTKLYWTAVLWVWPRTRRFVAASSRQRLKTWLADVEREALAAAAS
jgi:carbon monoxide dehydrogenase subunit G